MDPTQPLHFEVRRGGLWYVTITGWKLIDLTVEPTPDLKALGLLERGRLRAQLRFVQRQLDELDAAADAASSVERGRGLHYDGRPLVPTAYLAEGQCPAVTDRASTPTMAIRCVMEAGHEPIQWLVAARNEGGHNFGGVGPYTPGMGRVPASRSVEVAT